MDAEAQESIIDTDAVIKRILIKDSTDVTLVVEFDTSEHSTISSKKRPQGVTDIYMSHFLTFNFSTTVVSGKIFSLFTFMR